MKPRQNTLINRMRWISLAGSIGLLCACSSSDDTTGAEGATNKPKEAIFGEQIKALEKAKGLERALQQSDTKRREQLEEQAQ